MRRIPDIFPRQRLALPVTLTIIVARQSGTSSLALGYRHQPLPTLLRISRHSLGDIALSASPRQLGTAALVALVALRVGIGFHFFKEGSDKLQNPGWTSAGFLGNAKGQFADSFQNMVWDTDGLARLDIQEAEPLWGHFRERVVQIYAFDDSQTKKAEAVYKRRLHQLEIHFANYERDLKEYRLGIARRDSYRNQEDRVQVASLSGQLGTIESELRSKRAELIGPIDQIWNGFEGELNALAIEGQRHRGPITLARPGRRTLDSRAIDNIIPYFDLTLGLLLMVGLFTRSAAIAAGLFLCSVVVSQWPGTSGAVPVWPQLIEALALFVIAATASGRVAGVDFFVGLLRAWCCRDKQCAVTSGNASAQQGTQ
ncbi:MAG: DoxX family protein [Planctomycetes bacterium]|nr:DoxX family protein [Planctomycetota bacterium]